MNLSWYLLFSMDMYVVTEYINMEYGKPITCEFIIKLGLIFGGMSNIICMSFVSYTQQYLGRIQVENCNWVITCTFDSFSILLIKRDCVFYIEKGYLVTFRSIMVALLNYLYNIFIMPLHQ